MDTSPSATVAAIFDARRRELRITWSDLAGRTGIEDRSLMRYLNGEREMGIGQVIVTAQALGLDAGDVLRQAMATA